MIGKERYDFFEIAVDLAIAARGLRSAHGDEREPVRLRHSVENFIPCVAEQFYGSAGVPFVQTLDDALADVVDGLLHLYAERGGKPRRGVRVDGEQSAFGMSLGDDLDHGGGNGRLAHAALARNGNEFCGVFH